ncbi:MAG: DGQHR domain-containing protein [Arcobacter sp.]|uniref:DGQHR domain-containing protein n=1 Tax=Arcobacter sp. TaxID=1872629 RepID=UPI0025909495|nr:DGQHR domain-containing protein [Arcobacter sp.]MDD3008400.1 DGQHR domain-containing protein [Arcobacter sp.]
MITKYDKNGLLFEQKVDVNELKCFVFIEEVGKLVNMLTVARLEDGNPDGYQRLIKCAKVKSISNFLAKNNKNIIPNSITIAIGTELNCEVTNDKIIFDCNVTTPEFIDELLKCKDKNIDTRNLDTKNKPLIIDGQHRLFGLYKNNPKNKVIVTAIINAELEDQAFQFIVINQKSQKADTVSIKSIINSDLYDDKLKKRLIQVGITYGKTATILDYFFTNELSPFKGLLLWSQNPDTNKKIIDITAIEQIYKVCDIETRGLSEESQLLEFITIMWTKIKSLFNDVWYKTIENPQYSNIFKKATLISITEYILSEAKPKIREYRKQLLDFEENEIEQLVETNLAQLPAAFFTSVWRSGLDNSNGRETIKASISTIIDNVIMGEEWNLKVPVIDYSKNSSN